MKKVELLAPAGNLEKLKMAVLYGADAVYLAGEKFGLRTASDNFTLEEMKEGIDFAHGRGCKVYLTMNIIPHNEDFEDAAEFVEEAAKAGIDAVIVSDPGMFTLVKKTVPDLDIHISTQANITNAATAKFWYEMGASRVVLARELSFKEILEIRESIPGKLELEAFVHGAMCMSYSGRCLLSNFLTGRDANKGDCAQPCRWKYYLMEEKRPGEYFPIEENEKGTFIFNSKDLCMIRHIPELIESGIFSFKIEGRVKAHSMLQQLSKHIGKQLMLIMNRLKIMCHTSLMKNGMKSYKGEQQRFYNRFLFQKPNEEDHNFGMGSYIRTYSFIGIIKGYDDQNGQLIIEQRNKFSVGDRVEVLPPDGPYIEFVIEDMYDCEGNKIETAPHPQMEVRIPFKKLPVHSLLRKPANIRNF